MANWYTERYYHNEAVRILKKNNPDFDEQNEESKLAIAMMMEDLEDKYRDEVFEREYEDDYDYED